MSNQQNKIAADAQKDAQKNVQKDQANVQQQNGSKQEGAINHTDSYGGLLPYYKKYLTDAIPGVDFRKIMGKCSVLSSMMLSSKFVSKEHPLGLFDKASVFGFVEGDKSKEDLKQEKDKKERGKKDKKDKKKDKKDKKHKKEYKDKRYKDKKDRDSKYKKDDRIITDNKMRSVREYLLGRSESISAFAPCMQLVKCPNGDAGQECANLKKATAAQLSAERCWYRYLEQLTECSRDKKNCVKRLISLEEACMHDSVRAVKAGRSVLSHQ